MQRILLFGGVLISLTSALLTDIQVISKLLLIQNRVLPCNAITSSMYKCVCGGGCVCVCVCMKEKFLKELVDGGVHF